MFQRFWHSILLVLLAPNSISTVLVLCISRAMSTFNVWHFVAVALFLPRFVVGKNLAQRAVGHVVDFSAVKPDWFHPVAAGVNHLDGSIRRAACRGQNQDCCA